jgi:predicted dehydrogenase
MSERRVKVAVLGVGHLGQHHARIYAEHPNAELVAVVDTDERRGREIAKKHKTRWVSHYHEIIDEIQAASIAVPTVYHYDIARELMIKGIHCLVEKPITHSVETADALVKLAQANNLVLQVGHIERFNAAIMRLREILNNPGFIEIHRLGPYDPRVKDVGVVLDLMIHDIDIVLQCVNSPVTNIDAVGVMLFSDKEDIANARLTFANGCICNLTSSRVTPVKKRKIRIFQSDAYISINYAKQSMEVYRKVPVRGAKPGEPSHKIVRQAETLEREEPLLKELEHFLFCVDNQIEPNVTGEHATSALEVAIEVTKKVRKSVLQNPATRDTAPESVAAAVEEGSTVEMLSPNVQPSPDAFSAADIDDEDED